MQRIIKFCFIILLCLLPTVMFAQVKAIVLDAQSKQPIVGANVTVMGIKNTSTTNSKGSFFLNINAGSFIKITHIGYRTLKVKATDGAVYYMKQKVNTLNEIVKNNIKKKI